VEMSCQAFGGLLKQYGNSVITDVNCLNVEVNNVVGNYFANILEATCLNLTNSNKSQDLITKKLFFSKPATYIFLVDKQTFKNYFRNYYCQCLSRLSSYTNYFPLYVGSTNDFSRRYKEFRCSLRCGEDVSHVFGGNLHQHLITLTNFSSMKMCLVVFYTDSKDKAKCIEHFILTDNNFCKTFNSNRKKTNCSINGFQQRIADDIIKTIQKLKSCP
jgi:hypothetical protein